MNNKIPDSNISTNHIFEPLLSDEKLLEVLSTYHKNSKLKNLDTVNLSGLPFSFGLLSDLTDLSQKWVSKRYHLLVQEGIFLPKYIINPFFFNFKLFIIRYDRKNSEYLDSLQDFMLLDTKLDFTDRVRIVIYSEPIQKLVSATLFNDIFDISKIEFYNNVSGISSNFTSIPNFNFNLEKNKNNTAIFVNNKKQLVNYLKFTPVTGKFYPHLLKLDQTQRLLVTKKVLDYIYKNGIIENLTVATDELNISFYLVKEIYSLLIENNIVIFFPRISSLSSVNDYVLFGTGNKETNKDSIKILYSNLLKLPKSVSFIDKNFIFSIFSLPESYNTTFFKFITGFIGQLDIKYTILTEPINIDEIFVPERFLEKYFATFSSNE